MHGFLNIFQLQLIVGIERKLGILWSPLASVFILRGEPRDVYTGRTNVPYFNKELYELKSSYRCIMRFKFQRGKWTTRRTIYRELQESVHRAIHVLNQREVSLTNQPVSRPLAPIQADVRRISFSYGTLVSHGRTQKADIPLPLDVYDTQISAPCTRCRLYGRYINSVIVYFMIFSFQLCSFDRLSCSMSAFVH